MPEHSSAGGQRCRLRLLGRWQLVADSESVELGHREERLTALLGLSGRSSRLHVAGVLWPESTDARALASLRRAVLQTQERSPGLLHADRLTIGLGADVDVDVDEVRRAAAATEEALAEGEAGALVRRLVGEELLPDWYDDWVLRERECLEQLRMKALERIARHALEAGDLELTVDAANAASDIDPLLESAGELAIRAHLDRGDPGSARREFDRYRDAVRDELDVPPSRTILDLIEPVLTAGSPAPQEAERVSHQGVVAAPLAPTTAPPPARTWAAIPGLPPEPVGSTGAGGAVARLLAVAALVLAAAVMVAGVGYERDGGDLSESDGAPQSTMRVLPADDAIQAGQMVVRPVDAAVGNAAFLVRTTLRPARVRFEVRDPAGDGVVVRNLMVLSARGRVLELDGLDPGRYRWLATSSVASTVSGRLRIPDQSVPADAVGSLEAAGPASTASAAPGSSTASLGPSSATDRPVPSQQPHEDSPSSSTPEARPTGRPIDPGTSPETPVS